MCIICNLGTEPTRAQTVALKLESVQRGEFGFYQSPPPRCPNPKLSTKATNSAPCPALDAALLLRRRCHG